jgi:lysozyme
VIKFKNWWDSLFKDDTPKPTVTVAPVMPAVPKSRLQPTAACYEFLKQMEGIRDGDPSTPELDPYICPGGWVTQGWGHVLLDEKGQMLHGTAGLIKAKQLYLPITMEQAQQLLEADVAAYANHVRRIVRGPTAPHEFDAMVSLCYNIGMGAFTKSSVARFHNEGKHVSSLHPFTLDGVVTGAIKPDNAADAFLLWTKSAGRRLSGLVNRRRAERAMYMGQLV